MRCADKLLDNSLRGKGNINFNGYSVPDTIQKGVQARPYKKVTISIYHTRTEEQIADIFTKPLPEQPFMKFREKMMGW